MNNKHYSLPFEMVFKTHYCSSCGAKLGKEKTHRVVTPDDIDYFQYQDYNEFPRRNCDVYDHQFRCGNCYRRFSNVDQRIIERIQKKKGKTILSSTEIKDEYQQSKEKDTQSSFWRSIFLPAMTNFVFFGLFFVFGKENVFDKWYIVLLMFVLLTTYTTIMAIRGHRGSHISKKNRDYSYEDEEKINRLYTYSFANKSFVMESEKCYCFACKREMGSEEVADFSVDEGSAICPYCHSKSILPDALSENIDNIMIDKMHRYWF